MFPLSSAYFSTPAAIPGKFIPVNIRNNHSLLPNPKVLIVSILDKTPADPVARKGGGGSEISPNMQSPKIYWGSLPFC
jgi:hypothetical protein